jgi:hypothetical protein
MQSLQTDLDDLLHETTCVDIKLHNVFNEFLLLTNTQFIENVSNYISNSHHDYLIMATSTDNIHVSLSIRNHSPCCNFP